MKLRPLLLLAGLLVAVLAAVVLFFALFEQVEVERSTGIGPEARRDPFLACRRFLTEMGLPTRQERGLKQLPPPGHLLLIAHPLVALSPNEADRLLEWVKAGGYLLAPAEDQLAKKLGLEFRTGEDEEQETGVEEAAVEETKIEETPAVESPVTVRLASRPGVEHELGLEPGFRLDLAQNGYPAAFVAEATPGEGYALVRYTLGRGWVTVFVAPEIFTNLELGEAEHASFLWSLVTVAGQPNGATLIYGIGRATLSELLWKYGWTALVSLLVGIGFWLWRRWPRFGPLVAEPPRDRRSLLEHIGATSEYLWRQGEAPLLVASARQALLRRAALRLPGFAQMPSQTKIERLAAASELPAEEIGWALGSRIESDTGGVELLKALQILERVRRKL